MTTRSRAEELGMKIAPSHVCYLCAQPLAHGDPVYLLDVETEAGRLRVTAHQVCVETECELSAAPETAPRS